MVNINNKKTIFTFIVMMKNNFKIYFNISLVLITADLHLGIYTTNQAKRSKAAVKEAILL